VAGFHQGSGAAPHSRLLAAWLLVIAKIMCVVGVCGGAVSPKNVLARAFVASCAHLGETCLSAREVMANLWALFLVPVDGKRTFITSPFRPSERYAKHFRAARLLQPSS
jgi:hypothetical protein